MSKFLPLRYVMQFKVKVSRLACSENGTPEIMNGRKGLSGSRISCSLKGTTMRYKLSVDGSSVFMTYRELLDST